jgi:hypothetical protein
LVFGMMNRKPLASSGICTSMYKGYCRPRVAQ